MGMQVSRAMPRRRADPGDWFFTSDKGRVDGDRVIVTADQIESLNSGGEKSTRLRSKGRAALSELRKPQRSACQTIVGERRLPWFTWVRRRLRK